MTFKDTHAQKVTIAIALVLAILLAIVGSFAVQLYGKYNNALTQVQVHNMTFSYRKNIVVENIDTNSNVVLAKVTSVGGIHGAPYVIFHIDESTKINRQIPILREGIVVGFSEVVGLGIQDLTVGAEVRANLRVQADGALKASLLTITSI